MVEAAVGKLEVVDVRIDITSRAPLMAVYSPSHAVRVEHVTEHRAVATWSEERALPDRDLVLYWSSAEGDLDAQLLSYFPAALERLTEVRKRLLSARMRAASVLDAANKKGAARSGAVSVSAAKSEAEIFSRVVSTLATTSAERGP